MAKQTNEELNPELDFLGLGSTVRGFVPDQRLFDRYILRRILDWGGAGVVWLALDEHSKEEVVLRILPDFLRRDTAFIDELLQETSQSMELIHPHIVRIHDLIDDTAVAVISMEFVDGHTLATWLTYQPNKAFEVEQVREWTGQLIDALDYAHNQVKIVHGDLKPDNLLINASEDLKIAYFGISRRISESLNASTAHGSATDILSYTSPQLATGGKPTVQDDIYAFAATLYELLASEPPCFSDNKEVLAQTWEVWPPPMTLRRQVLGIEGKPIPDEWEKTIAACLATDPAARPQSIVEVGVLLGLRAAPVAIPGAKAPPRLLPAKTIAPELRPEALLKPEPKAPPSLPIKTAPSAPEPELTPHPPELKAKSKPKPEPIPKLEFEPKSRSTKFSSKDRMVILCMVVLFALDGFGYYFIVRTPQAQTVQAAELAQQQADAKAAADALAKQKAADDAAQAAAQTMNDEEKAVLEKAKQDAESHAAASDQATQQAKADAEKAQQTAQSATQRLAAITGPVAGLPWSNSLDVKFVPAGTDNVLFSVWDVRVKDYALFVAATGRDWPKPGFDQTENDPAVMVSWDDANAFCDWLTKKEQAEGKLGADQKYRLPTDAEWSKAVGLNEDSRDLPKDKDGKVKDVYPWGSQWPPPQGVGNYAEILTNDGFVHTSPMGSFPANAYGLYDMGGNVWQWCEDRYDYKHDWRVLRGASWVDRIPQSLLSSCRSGDGPGAQDHASGFRVVVVLAP